MEDCLLNHDFKKGVKNYSDSLIEEPPEDYKGPYGEFGKYVGGIKFKDWSMKSSDYQILKFENDKGFQFLLKRMTTPCSVAKDPKDLKDSKYSEVPKDPKDPKDSKDQKDALLSSPEIKKFLTKGMNEFIISKLVSGHPNGINSYDYSLIRIEKQNLFVMEFLIEDAGQTIKKNVFAIMKDPQKVVDILTQSASILAYLESFQIPFYDLTLENFLIDKFGLFKFISFDIANIAKHSVKVKSGDRMQYIEFSDGYGPPELLKIYNNPQHSNSNKEEESYFSIWKSNVYSWGMMALLLLGGISDIMTFQQMDKSKNEQNYQNLLQLINFINLGKQDSENLKEIIKFLLSVCLEYDPTKRATFQIINKTLTQLKEENIEIVKKQVTQLLNNQNNIVSPNIQKSKNLEQQAIAALQERNTFIALIENQKKALFESQSKLSEYDVVYKNSQITIKFQEQNIIKLQQNINEMGNKIKTIETHCEYYKQEIERLNSSRSNVYNDNYSMKNTLEALINILKEKINYQFISLENLGKDIKTTIADCIVDSRDFFNNLNTILRKSSVKPPSPIKTFPEVERLINGLVEGIKNLTIKSKMHHKAKILPENVVSTSVVEDNDNFILEQKTETKDEPKREYVTKCPKCDQNQDFKSIKLCIYQTKDWFTPGLLKEIENKRIWNLSLFEDGLTYKAIKMLLALLKVSKEIQFINFGCSNEFDFKCGIDFLEALQANFSLRGIVFYKKYLQKESFDSLINIFLNKLNLKFIIYERNEEFNQFVENKLKYNFQFALDNWSRLSVITEDLLLNLNIFYQDKSHYWVITKRQFNN